METWNNLENQSKIWNFKHRIVQRKRIINGTTETVDCVKVSYSSIYSGIFKYFSTLAVVAYQEDLVELFLIKLKLKGPSWVKV